MPRMNWGWVLGLVSGAAVMAGSRAVAAVLAANEVDVRHDVVVSAIERAMPSVVNIRTTKMVRRNDPYEVFFRRFYGLEDDNEGAGGVGSGVIIDAVGEEGYILTNVHVVQRANRVQVQLWDGRVYEASLLSWINQKDLALLKIVRRSEDPVFQPITMAKDDDLLLGETVIAVGNPFGLGGSVSRGILSSKNRRPDSGGQKLDYPDWLQTDADINPGNSGGPLININGELIGINVAIYSPAQGKGTGFAIPVKQISSALSDFFSLEASAKLYLGARFRGSPAPITVREVQNGSPADQGGLRVGQEILEVNDQPVSSLASLNQLIAGSPNRHATVTVLDNGTKLKLTIQMRLLLDLDQELVSRRLGLTVQPITDEQAASFGLPGGEGWVINEVEKQGPAMKAGMQPGMVIMGMNGIGVADQLNIANLLGNRKSGEPVQLSVRVLNRYGDGYARVLTGQVDLVVR